MTFKVGDKVIITMPDIWKGKMGVIKDINGVNDDVFYHVFWDDETKRVWLHFINIKSFNEPEKVVFN